MVGVIPVIARTIPVPTLTYLEQYAPVWVAEVLALAELVGEDDSLPFAA